MLGVLSSALGVVTGKISLLLLKAGATASWILSSLWEATVAVLAAVFNYVSGVVVFLSLLLGAIGLRVLGVEDTYTRLGGTRGPTDTSSTDPMERALDVSPDAVTDEKGRFSRRAFVEVTGMSPAEFIHLYVKRSGGRVRQKTLNTCLPWSKSTVSRILDTLEGDETVVRVEVGRQKLVCIPDSVPDIDRE